LVFKRVAFSDLQRVLFICDEGNIRPAAEIMAHLKHILADNAPAAEHPLGFLTTERRDVWSKLREKLLAAGKFIYAAVLHFFIWILLACGIGIMAR
jgi:hypothetical protein